MQLLFESWRQYLKESVFHVKIELLLPTEELGHGKDHVCPSQECENLIQQIELYRNKNDALKQEHQVLYDLVAKKVIAFG